MIPIFRLLALAIAQSVTAPPTSTEPYWWRSWWALALIGVVLALGIFAVDRFQRRRLLSKERKRTQARELEQARQIETMNRQLRENQELLEKRNLQLREQQRHLVEIAQAKDRFFSNISHELRTPLTLLVGPLRDMTDGLSSTERLVELVPSMYRNAERLRHLIDNLLDLSKLEAGSMQLHPEQVDLASFVRSAVASFVSHAERKGISMSFTAVPEHLPAWFDIDKLEKVLANLLSNAIKYTQPGGKIQTAVRSIQAEGQAFAEVAVRDTGCGIPLESIDRVFDRFYQVETAASIEQTGTGIGLALTKELVELHGGTIRVESQPGFGSTFIVQIPALQEQEVDPLETPDSARPAVLRWNGYHHMEQLEVSDMTADSTEHNGNPLLLLVEDNLDLVSYTRGHLAGRFRVIEAYDGQEGLRKAISQKPDVVVSDVRMPLMDGFELCLALKQNPETSHIPVILLTVRADETSKIRGLEAGADDYLLKPFNPEELLVRIDNLIHLRRKLKVRMGLPDRLEGMESMEEEFMHRVRVAIEDHLGENGFTIEWLAGEVGIGERQLQRKIQSSTGMTAAAYVRCVRLERAAQLLRARVGTVSEIAYRVGFRDVEHFSRMFKQAYGTSPSRYATELTSIPEKSDG